ncbi:MAG: OmpH family outer membrane protein [Deltaproteobacteria bacterium]|nr:OmpH family outer membrane protein [Deltaproteobacteria bacterium]
MRRTIWLLLCLALFPSAGWPEDTLKVGVVDVQRVISGSQVGKRAKEKFRAEVKKAEAELLKEKQEVERLKGDLDKKGALLRAEEKQELERQFQRRYRDYLREMQSFQEELRQRENEMTAQILDDLREVVVEIGKKEAFTVILGQAQMLYSGKALDITDRVIELYNQRNSKAPTAGK